MTEIKKRPRNCQFKKINLKYLKIIFQNLKASAKLESFSELHPALIVYAVSVLNDVAYERGVLDGVRIVVHATPRRRLVVVLAGRAG